MNIGFVNIFSFRPHVEHLNFLQAVLKKSGHDTFFLTCDSSVSNCYAQAIKGSRKLSECSKCIVGGVRSLAVKEITSISAGILYPDLTNQELDDIALSSSCTLNRTESEHEWGDADVLSVRKSLHKPILVTYRSTVKWVSDNKLDAVICFNGRMDMPRAVTYACESSGIPYITHERTWFGDGLNLIPNANCLSIKLLRDMVKEYDNKPLTAKQAQFAGRLIALRFLQKNTLEWRLYNKNAESIAWPVKSKARKVLVLPSSKNEFAGHEEWKTGWVDNTTALDDFFKVFSINTDDVVVRFHPNWAETIGKVSGERALNHYTQWAKSRGVHFISSEEKADTYDLIQQADIVVLNGGSSSVEAGACGKQVICLGPSSYDGAGFVRTFINKDDLYRHDALVDLSPEIIVKKTLRYVYLRAKRFPQYVDYVKAIKTTEYKYFDGANADRIINMFKTGLIKADDPCFSGNEEEESCVVNMLDKKQWALLSDYEDDNGISAPLSIQRRVGLRWIDGMRSKLARGDR
ncbi:MAG: capsule biosynthesis protein [Proteobacteria bacterium]|nr:capsule biosynthesis protein [Pseudomonadota bacterium]